MKPARERDIAFTLLSYAHIQGYDEPASLLYKGDVVIYRSDVEKIMEEKGLSHGKFRKLIRKLRERRMNGEPLERQEGQRDD